LDLPFVGSLVLKPTVQRVAATGEVGRSRYPSCDNVPSKLLIRYRSSHLCPATGCANAARRRHRSPVVSELARTSQRRSGRPQRSQGNRQIRRHVESSAKRPLSLRRRHVARQRDTGEPRQRTDWQRRRAPVGVDEVSSRGHEIATKRRQRERACGELSSA